MTSEKSAGAAVGSRKQCLDLLNAFILFDRKPSDNDAEQRGGDGSDHSESHCRKQYLLDVKYHSPIIFQPVRQSI
jgi:hypothetical protein